MASKASRASFAMTLEGLVEEETNLNVWILNPYPRTDTAHWESRLPKSGRPEYVPGVIDTEDADGGLTVRTTWEPVKTVTGKKEDFLPMDPVSARVPYCIAFLKNLHEQGILDNLQKRFIKNKTYTLAGELLVSMNPYCELKDEEGVAHHR